ncbi:MAG: HIT domain-containing protein [Mariprofundaceae bacterium]|nr:HIT domain-containing protein [Mariprofundaceae bacterium]
MILHARLEKDCFVLGQLKLSLLLLMNDARYPWFILVPQRKGISEIQQLAAEDRQALLEESCMLSEALHAAFSPDRINVAALGNVVPQLHVHHIARFTDDDAWPAPVWGAHPCRAYTSDQRDRVCAKLTGVLPEGLCLLSDGM